MGEEEFTRPGHVVPLRYTQGGVTRRRGHTEAAVGEFPSRGGPSPWPTFAHWDFILDLCYLAGEPAAGVLCELVNPDAIDGSMARRDDCWKFAQKWGLKMISVADLAEYVSKEGKGRIPGVGQVNGGLKV